MSVAALLALAPKCLLCGLAYAGLGSALGLAGPELCGGSSSPAGAWIGLAPVLGGALGVISFMVQAMPSGRSLLANSSTPTKPGQASDFPTHY